MQKIIHRHFGDSALRWGSFASGLLLLLIVIAMILAMVRTSSHSIHVFGLHFFLSSDWDPAQQQFGAGAILVGTLITTLIALLLAVPLSLLSAVCIAHLLPRKLAYWLGVTVEMMAAIPSVIYGMWGLFVLANFLGEHVYPQLLAVCEPIPVLRYLFAGLPIGTNILTAGIVLAIMIYPLMTAMMRDVFALVPDTLVEASYGAGLTRWQTVRHIFVHYSRAGLFGSIVLGLTRAFGETMAVTFVIGNAHNMFAGLLLPGSTIASTIANEFSEASSPLYVSSLLELGLVLLVISILILLLARALIHHSVTRGGSQ